MKPLKRIVQESKRSEDPNSVILKGRDPRRVFYSVYSGGNLDGSIDFASSEHCEGVFDTEKQATERAEHINNTYPTLECFVYHCKPVAKVWRGEMRVTKLK